MASLTQWTWVWARFRRWWRSEKPTVLQSTVLQRVGHEWAIDNNKRKRILPSLSILSTVSGSTHSSLGASLFPGCMWFQLPPAHSCLCQYFFFPLSFYSRLIQSFLLFLFWKKITYFKKFINHIVDANIITGVQYSHSQLLKLCLIYS